MLSAKQIPGFLSQLFFQNKSMKQPHFLHIETNSQKFTKGCWRISWLAVVKNGHGFLAHETLKSAASEE